MLRSRLTQTLYHETPIPERKTRSSLEEAWKKQGHPHPHRDELVGSRLTNDKGFAVSKFRQHSLSLSVAHEKAGNALKRLGKSNLRTSKAVVAALLRSGTPERCADGVAVTEGPGFRGLASTSCIDRVYLTTLKRLLLDPKKDRFQIHKLYFELSRSQFPTKSYTESTWPSNPSFSNPTERRAGIFTKCPSRTIHVHSLDTG